MEKPIITHSSRKEREDVIVEKTVPRQRKSENNMRKKIKKIK
jgi:hypothetical protein